MPSPLILGRIDPDDCVFYIQLPDTKYMKLLFESLYTMLFEADLLFECFPDKIKISGMTELESSVVYASLDPAKFDRYELKAPYKFSIYHKNAYLALKNMAACNTLVIAFIDSPTNADLYNNIIFQEIHANGDLDTNLIRRLEVDQIMAIPNLRFDTFVRCESARFNQIIKNMKNFKCKNVTVIVTANVIDFQCRQDGGNNTRTSQIVRDTEDDDTDDVRDTSGTYPVDSLMNIAKASSLSKLMRLYIQRDRPLCVQLEVGKYGYVNFVCTPTVVE